MANRVTITPEVAASSATIKSKPTLDGAGDDPSTQCRALNNVHRPECLWRTADWRDSQAYSELRQVPIHYSKRVQILLE